MSLSDSQTRKRKRSLETSEVFDSVFVFLMDFADKAETIVDGDTIHDDEREPSENGGDRNAGELFNKLPVKEKEELLKDVFGEIVGNILDNLPDDGKEEFLVRCFDGLFPKLPGGSRRVIKHRMIPAPPQSQEAPAIQSAPESLLAFPKEFPKGDLVEVSTYVDCPPHLWRRGPRSPAL